MKFLKQTKVFHVNSIDINKCINAALYYLANSDTKVTLRKSTYNLQLSERVNKKSASTYDKCICEILNDISYTWQSYYKKIIRNLIPDATETEIHNINTLIVKNFIVPVKSYTFETVDKVKEILPRETLAIILLSRLDEDNLVKTIPVIAEYIKSIILNRPKDLELINREIESSDDLINFIELFCTILVLRNGDFLLSDKAKSSIIGRNILEFKYVLTNIYNTISYHDKVVTLRYKIITDILRSDLLLTDKTLDILKGAIPYNYNKDFLTYINRDEVSLDG